MPTATWERLPEAKRAIVLEAAEAELAAHGFSGSSLNAICAKAGISKGSLFQYFTNKADLFAYLADRAAARMRAYINEIAAKLPWDTDILGATDTLVGEWVRYFYEEEHKRDLAMLVAADLEHELDAVAAVRPAVYGHYVELVGPLVDLGIVTGQYVDNGRDAAVASVVMAVSHLAIAPHVRGIDPVLGLFGAEREEAVRIGQGLVRHALAALVPPQGQTSGK